LTTSRVSSSTNCNRVARHTARSPSSGLLIDDDMKKFRAFSRLVV
jgi:hypothetical protein